MCVGGPADVGVVVDSVGEGQVGARYFALRMKGVAVLVEGVFGGGAIVVVLFLFLFVSIA